MADAYGARVTEQHTPLQTVVALRHIEGTATLGHFTGQYKGAAGQSIGAQQGQIMLFRLGNQGGRQCLCVARHAQNQIRPQAGQRQTGQQMIVRHQCSDP